MMMMLMRNVLLQGSRGVTSGAVLEGSLREKVLCGFATSRSNRCWW
jgi:hypothetical protein